MQSLRRVSWGGPPEHQTIGVMPELGLQGPGRALRGLDGGLVDRGPGLGVEYVLHKGRYGPDAYAPHRGVD